MDITTDTKDNTIHIFKPEFKDDGKEKNEDILKSELKNDDGKDNFEYNGYVEKQIEIIRNSNLPSGNKNYVIELINAYRQKCINKQINSCRMIENISSIIKSYKQHN